MRLERHSSHDLQTGGALPRAAALCHAPSRAGGLPTRVSMAGTVLRFSGSIRAQSRPIAPNRAKTRHMGYVGANRKLVDEGVIAPVGNGRARRYVPAGQHVT